MAKSKLSFIIDAAMFLCLMALAGLGFLMKYVLPSGRSSRGRGRRPDPCRQNRGGTRCPQAAKPG